MPEVNKTLLPTVRVYTGVAAYHSFIKTNDGSVYGHGRNCNGQLAIQDNNSRANPTLVQWFIENGKELKQAACGESHSLFLLGNGEIWSCGYNGNGQLGMGDTKDRGIPERIIFRFKCKIIEISCGNFSSYCLTKDGDVYSFGYNGNGELGLAGMGVCTNIYSPSQIVFPKQRKIVRISAGSVHAAAISSIGDVFTWGCNSLDQLGRAGDSTIPLQIEGLPSNKKPLQVICGGNVTSVAYSTNEIYGIGCNGCGELGLGNSENEIAPARIRWFNDKKVKKISAGGAHVFAILESGDTVAYGHNGYSQLVVGEKKNQMTPLKLPDGTIPNAKIVDAVCGSLHSILVTDDGSCFGVGLAEALGREKNVRAPLKLLEDVDLGDSPLIPASQFLEDDMTKYILNQQNTDEGCANENTDVKITVLETISGKKSYLYANKAMIKAKFRTYEISTNIELETGGTFTDSMKTVILRQFYGATVDLAGLNVVELVSIHDMLNRWEIGQFLKAKCELAIRTSMNTHKTAVRVYEAAEKLGDEVLVQLALNDIRQRNVEYLTEMLEIGSEFLTKVQKKVAKFSGFVDTPPILELVQEPKLVECMTFLFNERKKNGDILLKGANGNTFRAIKFVLIARSAHFAEILNSQAKYTKEDIIELDIPLERTFNSFLQYLYTDEARFTYKHCFRILSYIKHLGDVEDADLHLKDYCERKIKSGSLTLDNCMAVYKISIDMKMERLLSTVLDFIAKNYVALQDQIEALPLLEREKVNRTAILYLFSKIPTYV